MIPTCAIPLAPPPPKTSPIDVPNSTLAKRAKSDCLKRIKIEKSNITLINNQIQAWRIHNMKKATFQTLLVLHNLGHQHTTKMKTKNNANNLCTLLFFVISKYILFDDMWCLARFGTICKIKKTWKTLKEEKHSKSNIWNYPEYYSNNLLPTRK